MVSLLVKIFIFIKVVKLVKNWQDFLRIYLHLTKNEYVVLELRNGLKIKIRVNSTDLIAFTHVWILEEYGKPGFEISNTDIIIDIGAHIGLFALYASQFCKEGKIHCFEPVKENFDMLLSNIELNSLKNIMPENVAVAGNDGSITIYMNRDESGHSMYVPSKDAIETTSVSLNTIFHRNSIKKCNFLKIDCEGCEYTIIESMNEDQAECIEKMCIEYHFKDEKPHLFEKLIAKLNKYSFSINTRDISNSIGFLYARK